MKLANTMIIFNNSSEVMMTLFIIRERTIEQCLEDALIENTICVLKNAEKDNKI